MPQKCPKTPRAHWNELLTHLRLGILQPTMLRILNESSTGITHLLARTTPQKRKNPGLSWN